MADNQNAAFLAALYARTTEVTEYDTVGRGGYGGYIEPQMDPNFFLNNNPRRRTVTTEMVLVGATAVIQPYNQDQAGFIQPYNQDQAEFVQPRHRDQVAVIQAPHHQYENDNDRGLSIAERREPSYGWVFGRRGYEYGTVGTDPISRVVQKTIHGSDDIRLDKRNGKKAAVRSRRQEDDRGAVRSRREEDDRRAVRSRREKNDRVSDRDKSERSEYSTVGEHRRLDMGRQF